MYPNFEVLACMSVCVCVCMHVLSGGFLDVLIDYCAKLMDSRDLRVFDDWDPNQRYIHVHVHVSM